MLSVCLSLRFPSSPSVWPGPLLFSHLLFPKYYIHNFCLSSLLSVFLLVSPSLRLSSFIPLVCSSPRLSISLSIVHLYIPSVNLSTRLSISLSVPIYPLFYLSFSPSLCFCLSSIYIPFVCLLPVSPFLCLFLIHHRFCLSFSPSLCFFVYPPFIYPLCLSI